MIDRGPGRPTRYRPASLKPFQEFGPLLFTSLIDIHMRIKCNNVSMIAQINIYFKTCSFLVLMVVSAYKTLGEDVWKQMSMLHRRSSNG